MHNAEYDASRPPTTGLPDHTPSNNPSARELFNTILTTSELQYWVEGYQNFTDGSKMTEAMKQHPHIQKKIAEIQNVLKSGNTPEQGPNFDADPRVNKNADWPWHNVGKGNIRGTVRFATDAVSAPLLLGNRKTNFSDAYALKIALGSFAYSWAVHDHGNGTATIEFRVYNPIGRESATRIPSIFKSKLGEFFLGKIDAESSLKDVPLGRLATQHQYFYFSVDITY